MSSNQVPQTLFYSGETQDSLNLANYVDQVFNEAPISEVAIPLLAKSAEDVKLDNKLNVNFDNLSVIGEKNVRAIMSPSSTSISIDLTEVEENQNLYTVESSGWINVCINNPSQDDYIELTCIDNNFKCTSGYINSSLPITATIPVSEYQTVEININANSDSSEKTANLIPMGTDTNIGESLANTRDYKALMAGIGFPKIDSYEELVLPESGAELYISNSGYYSIKATLSSSNDYISIYTENYGSTMSYTGHPDFMFFPVTANSKITIEYSLNNISDIEYYRFIPTVGSAE